MSGVFDPPELAEDDEDPAVVRAQRPATPARIRRAATLILLDRSAGQPTVLMGRRAGGHDFMPDKWVFPGGRAERADAFAPAASEIDPDVAGRLAGATPRTSPRMARALGMAAIRELREEAGLHLETTAPDGRALPDLSALALVGRAITPPYRPKRFDALFFLADAQRLRDREHPSGDGELDEIAWFPMADALQLDLPNVTRFVLRDVLQRLEAPERPPLYLRFHHGRHTVTPLDAA
jgi:8-oxo-dGTP pyrophosphatase MutT (NUDIX family)